MLLTLTNVLGSTILEHQGATGPVPPQPTMIMWNTSYNYIPNASAEENYSTEFYYKYNLPEPV